MLDSCDLTYMQAVREGEGERGRGRGRGREGRGSEGERRGGDGCTVNNVLFISS